MPFSEHTGRGVKVAVVDSGINPSHPHVAGVAGGICIKSSQAEDYLDFNGHGTAVAGAIREKSPDSMIFAVKVFNRSLTANIEMLIEALVWAIEHDMTVINLSLGTARQAHGEYLQRIVNLATEKNIAIVAAHNVSGQMLLPGSLPSVIGVEADSLCPRDSYRTKYIQGAPVFVASPYPRDIPGVPCERNLSGISFAVANMTGFVARAREMHPNCSVSSLLKLLAEQAECGGSRTPYEHA
ncbi:MAG: S8 family serine peptidase [Blastocatellia bacterium]